MPNNNPQGVNSFSRFAAEPAYGEQIQQKRLAGGAPLAGAPIAAGPLNMAARSKKQAVRGQPQPQQGQQVPAPSMTPSPQASLAATWASIAAIPGASDQVKLIAMQAQAQGG